jgi:hypothetical protein
MSESSYWNQYFDMDNTFMTTNDFYEQSAIEVLIAIIYFMFTTISTVGLGDFTPVNDIERLFCILILLVGVCLIGYLMEVLIIILNKYRIYQSKLNQDAKLSVFIATLINFNNNRELD